MTEPNKCCEACTTWENIPINRGLGCKNTTCPCHTTPTVEPTETGWEGKIPFQKHDKQCGYATCDSRVMIDFIRETLAIQKETLIAEMEKYIAENRHKVERPDRYVLDDIIKNLKGVE